jgi:hypothetical protein
VCLIEIRKPSQGISSLLEKVKKAGEDKEDASFVMDSPGRAWILVATSLKIKRI